MTRTPPNWTTPLTTPASKPVTSTDCQSSVDVRRGAAGSHDRSRLPVTGVGAGVGTICVGLAVAVGWGIGVAVGVAVGGAETSAGDGDELTAGVGCATVGSGEGATDAAGDGVSDGSSAVQPASVAASATEAMRRNLGMVRSPADAIRMCRRVSASPRSGV